MFMYQNKCTLQKMGNILKEFSGPKPASFMTPCYFDLLWTLAIIETK